MTESLQLTENLRSRIQVEAPNTTFVAFSIVVLLGLVWVSSGHPARPAVRVPWKVDAQRAGSNAMPIGVARLTGGALGTESSIEWTLEVMLATVLCLSPLKR